MPGAVTTSHTLSHLITTALWGTYRYYLNIISEENEVWKDKPLRTVSRLETTLSSVWKA